MCGLNCLLSLTTVCAYLVKNKEKPVAQQRGQLQFTITEVLLNIIK